MEPHDREPMEAAAVPARTNWAGNYIYRAGRLVAPGSVEELRALLPTLAAAKAVGTRHSFNGIADADGAQISLARMKAIAVDAECGTVTVGAGVTYGELAPFLHAHGFALHNLASLPHISVAGACATATHGSGLGNGCLATAVRGMELLRADGELVTLSRETTPELLRLAAVGLGALGVVVSLTLEIVPTFELAQTVYENLSFDALRGNLEEIFGAAYSVSLFTDWQGHCATQAWLKRKVKAVNEP